MLSTFFLSFSLNNVYKVSNSSDVNIFSFWILFISSTKFIEDILFICKLNSKHDLKI